MGDEMEGKEVCKGRAKWVEIIIRLEKVKSDPNHDMVDIVDGRCQSDRFHLVAIFLVYQQVPGMSGQSPCPLSMLASNDTSVHN
jgi:hypothetical protein